MALEEPEDKKASIPGWLVSFGDMMTLILTFFILLVSLASTQDAGLMASALGTFDLRLKNSPMPEEISGQEQRQSLDETRARFNLPPVNAEDRAETPEDAALVELVKAQSIDALPRMNEQLFPDLVRFEGVRTTLTGEQLDLLRKRVEWLRPGPEELLVLEVEPEATLARTEALERARLRAEHLRAILVEQNGFRSHRVETRVAPFGHAKHKPQPGEARARMLRKLPNKR